MRYGTHCNEGQYHRGKTVRSHCLLMKPQACSHYMSLVNVDYNEIEYLIKARISKGQAQPTAVQGKDNEARASQKFEDKLYAELCDQHQRIDLFVQSKARETSRRSRRGFRIVLLRQVLTGRFISASGQADRSAREASRVLESYQNHSEAAREVFKG